MNRVIAVVDRNFGERLSSMPVGVPVWVVDTPANQSVAHRLWKERPQTSHLEGITTFRFDLAESPEANLIEVMPTIDEHHGPLSADPPYMQIEVFGTVLTSRIRVAFAEYGFDEFRETRDCFVATRHRVPPRE